MFSLEFFVAFLGVMCLTLVRRRSAIIRSWGASVSVSTMLMFQLLIPQVTLADRDHSFFLEISLSKDLHRFRARAGRYDQAKREVAEVIQTAAQEVQYLYGIQPPTQLKVEILPTQQYHERTGAPSWTAGVLLNPALVVIPEPSSHNTGRELRYTLKHEYAHAAVAAVSGSRAPAWLDEGLAQIAEGNPGSPALIEQLKLHGLKHGCPTLFELRKGFDQLDSSTISMAYVYSRYATEHLLSWADKEKLLLFLRSLSNGEDLSSAFERTFEFSLVEFESRLLDNLNCSDSTSLIRF